MDDRRVLSGIIYVVGHGLQWRKAPAAYGPHKTLCNRFVRWSRMGVFARFFAALAAEGAPPAPLMIDAPTSRRIALPPASSKKGLVAAASAEPRAA